MFRYIILSLLFLISTVSLFAQKAVAKDDVIKTLKSIRSKLVAIPVDTAAESEQITAIRTQLNYAILNIEKDADSFPASYLESLEKLAVIVDLARVNTQEKSQILEIVSKDIRSKFSRPPDKMNSDSYIKLVKVVVMTQKEGQPVNNLRIHYNGLGYNINYSLPNYTFQDVTGPVQEDLVPGYYVMWAKKDGDPKILGKIITEINPAKENKITITIE